MNGLRNLTSLCIFGTVAACSTAGNPRSTALSNASIDGPGNVEDIYVVRSLREERSQPDAFCVASTTGFAATVQDRYSFKAVVTQAPTGKVVDSRAYEVGTARACFDGPPGVPDANFYAEFAMASLTFTGKGKCTAIAPNFPESGITSVRCFLVLSSLPPPYVAGVLTTNSVTSRQPIGDRSDPPGYTQPSIATIRLWRKQ
jgi:hypothetical protein